MILLKMKKKILMYFFLNIQIYLLHQTKKKKFFVIIFYGIYIYQYKSKIFSRSEFYTVEI